MKITLSAKGDPKSVAVRFFFEAGDDVFAFGHVDGSEASRWLYEGHGGDAVVGFVKLEFFGDIHIADRIAVVHAEG